ncbi:MAG TPA: hypothetical protein VL309_04485 [Vicinamibacterales bacterium]|nr:hypothetical protein [Vicinamibacterales bacterium]
MPVDAVTGLDEDGLRSGDPIDSTVHLDAVACRDIDIRSKATFPGRHREERPFETPVSCF